jgi:hypothetical protein
MKGLNLTDSSIREFYLLVTEDDDGNKDANVWYLGEIFDGEIFDDAGNYVNSVRVDVLFSALPAQIRAALNNAMRLVSKEFNSDLVEEDSETWTDL